MISKWRIPLVAMAMRRSVGRIMNVGWEAEKVPMVVKRVRRRCSKFCDNFEKRVGMWGEGWGVWSAN